MRFVVVVCLLCAQSWADDGGRAEDMYRLGEAAYRVGRYELACEAFEEAYKLSSFPSVLFDVGQSYRRRFAASQDTAHRDKAVDAYQKFIQSNPADSQQRGLAEKFAAALKSPEPKLIELPGTSKNEQPELLTADYSRKKNRRAWIWLGATVGVAAAVALSVGLGIGLGTHPDRIDWGYK